jgi:hypothetical protein
MSTIIRCTCGKKVRIQERYFGHRVRCPACGAIHVEPVREAAAPLATPIPAAEALPLAEPVPMAAPLAIYNEPAAPAAEPAPVEWEEFEEEQVAANDDHTVFLDAADILPAPAKSKDDETTWEETPEVVHDDFAGLMEDENTAAHDIIEVLDEPEVVEEEPHAAPVQEDDIDISALFEEDEEPKPKKKKKSR